MNGFTLGRYYPTNSLVHRLDPRAKILMMIILMVAVFLPAGFWGYLLIGALLLVAALCSKIPINYFLMGLRPVVTMLVFLFIINIFFLQSGNLLVEWSWFKLYDAAIIQTLYIVLRLVLMISVTTILTASTKPLDMTLGIEDLLTPFKFLGLPTHEISMMISIALRFIPTILEEALRIMKAQQSRGVDMEEGKIQEKIKAVLSLIIPLFVCAFQRAEDLANAMEARGYNPQGERTRFHQLRIGWLDIVVLALCLITLSGVVVVSSYL